MGNFITAGLPSVRHQELLVMLASELVYYMHSHGGGRKVLAAPCNVCLEGDDFMGFPARHFCGTA